MGEDISAILIAMSNRVDDLKQQGRFSEAIDLASQVCDNT